MNGVAVFYHAHDSAGGLSIIVRCHYCFMQRRIKALTQRIERSSAVSLFSMGLPLH